MSIKVYEAYRVAQGVDPFDLLWDIKRWGQAAAKQRLTPRFHDILDGKSHTNHLRHQERDRLFTAWMKEKYTDAPEGGSPPFFREYGTWLKEHCPPEFKTEAGVLSVSNEEILRITKRTVTEGVQPSALDIDSWMHAKYGEQVMRYKSDPWALDVAVTMRRYRNRFHLIPYCERSCLIGDALEFMGNDERLEEFGYWDNTDAPEEVSSQEWAWRGTVWGDLTEHERWTEYVTIDIMSWLSWSDVSPMMDVMRERGPSGV